MKRIVGKEARHDSLTDSINPASRRYRLALLIPHYRSEVGLVDQKRDLCSTVLVLYGSATLARG